MTPDEIVEHVNFFNNGDFLRGLFLWATDGWPLAPSAPRVRFREIAKARDLVMICHRIDLPEARSGDELVVNQIEFGPKSDLPFGLSWGAETPEMAVSRFGPDLYERANSISYFSADGLVASLYFKDERIGLNKIIVARLGAVRDWRRR